MRGNFRAAVARSELATRGRSSRAAAAEARAARRTRAVRGSSAGARVRACVRASSAARGSRDPGSEAAVCVGRVGGRRRAQARGGAGPRRASFARRSEQAAGGGGPVGAQGPRRGVARRDAADGAPHGSGEWVRGGRGAADRGARSRQRQGRGARRPPPAALRVAAAPPCAPPHPALPPTPRRGAGPRSVHSGLFGGRGDRSGRGARKAESAF